MKITIKREQRQMDLSLSSVSNLRGAKTRFRTLLLLPVSCLLLTGFTACGNDDNDTPEVNDGRVKFASGNVAKPQQRIGGANGDQWETGDKVGIYMVAHNSSTVTESAENKMYSTTSTGTSASFTNSTTPIYYPVNTPTKVDFIAYHPYAAVSDYVYNINLATQSPQSAIDLMLAKANNSGIGYDKNHNKAVNLVFDHQLVKLVLNVTAGDGISDLSTMTVAIEGMDNEAKFNLTSKALYDRVTVTAITPFKKENTTTYEAILLPVTALDANHKVTFTVAGNNYEWTMTKNTSSITKFEVGKRYTFDVTLQKEKVVVTGTINQWESIGGGDVTVN